MAEKAILVDTSKCIACKGCQIACKQWNELSAGKSEFFASTYGYENPSDLSFRTFTLIKFHLTEKDNGDPDWLFRKKNCMHCTDAACVANCQYDALQRDDATGFVYVNRDNCVGCQRCLNGTPEENLEGCPFGIPRYATESDLPEGVESGKMYKCWACLDRINGEINSDVVKESPIPACVKTCAPGALSFGDRDTMVANANTRKTELEAKGKTVYLYGVDELGGLHYIYILLNDPTFYGLPSSSDLSSSSRRAYLWRMRNRAKRFAKRFRKKIAA
jgi:formate dehydrogenase iron-sulfur subunit